MPTRSHRSSPHAVHVRIQKGDAIILFPGEWHRYRPDIKTGWAASWIGLKGDHALRLMNAFFSPEHPVFALKDPERILGGYQEMEKLVNRDPERFAGRIAALVTGLIDEIRLAARPWRAGAREELLNKAKLTLLARSQEDVDLAAMAKDLGLSCPSFLQAIVSRSAAPPIRVDRLPNRSFCGLRGRPARPVFPGQLDLLSRATSAGCARAASATEAGRFLPAI